MGRGIFLVVLALALVPRVTSSQGGSPLGPEFRINTFTTNVQMAPSVAADSAGNFVVTWDSNEQDGQYFGVYGQRYLNDGSPVGAEFRVNSYTTGIQQNAVLATDALGNFVVIWRSLDQEGPGTDSIFGQRFASTGARLGSEFRVNAYTTSLQQRPSVSADGSGNFIVVWVSYSEDASSNGVFGQRFSNAGAPQGPEFRVNTYTTGDQSDAQVSSNVSGEFVVVWTSADGSDRGIFGQRYAASGIPLGSEFRVNSYTTFPQVRPAVATDPTGAFVVVWTGYGEDGSSYGVFGQRFSASAAPAGTEFRVNTFTTAEQFDGRVATDVGGNFVVAWVSRTADGSSDGIFGQRYGVGGSPSGGEFRVNTYTTDYQQEASVTATDTGDFIVVWDSHFQDGSLNGVFGQRFGPIVPVELMHFGVD
jgi:hypothetical protein